MKHPNCIILEYVVIRAHDSAYDTYISYTPVLIAACPRMPRNIRRIPSRLTRMCRIWRLLRIILRIIRSIGRTVVYLRHMIQRILCHKWGPAHKKSHKNWSLRSMCASHTPTIRPKPQLKHARYSQHEAVLYAARTRTIPHRTPHFPKCYRLRLVRQKFPTCWKFSRNSRN